MAKHAFLSDDWVVEARRVRAEQAESIPRIEHPIRLNQIVTDVPFKDGAIEAHIDTSEGTLEIDLGHLDSPDAVISLDYETAKAIFVDARNDAGLQAFLEGRIKVQGDMTRLLLLMASVQTASTAADPAAVAALDHLREITA